MSNAIDRIEYQIRIGIGIRIQGENLKKSVLQNIFKI